MNAKIRYKLARGKRRIERRLVVALACPKSIHAKTKDEHRKCLLV